MKSRNRNLALWVFISFIFCSVNIYGASLPTDKLEHKLVYDRWEWFETRAESNRFDYQLGPYRIDENEFSAGPFQYLNISGDKEIALFGFASEAFRSEKEKRATGFEAIRGGFALAPSEKIFVYANFTLDEKKALNPDYSGKKWRGLAGGVETAAGFYQSESFDITFGRFASFWGVRNSLVLSGDVNLDGLEYRYRWGRLSLTYRLARLDGLNPERDSVAQFENRYFAGHRLDLHFGKGLRVGFFETVIFGGPGRSIDLFYLNPLLFFHSAQLNENSDDNTFLGFDFTCKPKVGTKIYGQLVIDDLQVDNKLQSDQEPNEFGFLVGLYQLDLVSGVDIRGEYERVSNRTFNQVLTRNRYTYHGELLGSASGNDYDRIFLSIEKWLAEFRVVKVNFSLMRQGEGRASDDWTEPWLDVEGDYSEPFPTGIVWKTARISGSFTSFLFDHAFIDLEAGIELHENFNQISGRDENIPFVGINLSLFGFTSVSAR